MDPQKSDKTTVKSRISCIEPVANTAGKHPENPDNSVGSGGKLPDREIFHKRFLRIFRQAPAPARNQTERRRFGDFSRKNADSDRLTVWIRSGFVRGTFVGLLG